MRSSRSTSVRGHRRRLGLATSVPRPRRAVRSARPEPGLRLEAEPGPLPGPKPRRRARSAARSSRSSTTTPRLGPTGHADRRRVRARSGGRLRRRCVRCRVRGRRRTAAVALGSAPPVRRHHAIRLRGARGPIERGVAVRREHRVSRRGPSSEDRPFPEELGRHGTTLLSGEESAVVEAVRRRGMEDLARADCCRRPHGASPSDAARATTGVGSGGQASRGLAPRTRRDRGPPARACRPDSARALRRSRATASTSTDRQRRPASSSNDSRAARSAHDASRLLVALPRALALFALALAVRLAPAPRALCCIPTATSTCSWLAGSPSISSRRPCSGRAARSSHRTLMPPPSRSSRSSSRRSTRSASRGSKPPAS